MKKVYKSFNIAGMQYYEALFVINDIKVGDRVLLKSENNNIYDENEVEIYYKDKKLGYIPKNTNYSIATILSANWDIFEAYIQKIDRDELEIQIAIFIKENRE
jgi:hypothetical protein